MGCHSDLFRGMMIASSGSDGLVAQSFLNLNITFLISSLLNAPLLLRNLT